MSTIKNQYWNFWRYMLMLVIGFRVQGTLKPNINIYLQLLIKGQCKSRIWILKFLIFSKSYFQKHKISAQSLNFHWMWLVNELVLTFTAPIKCAKAQFNLIILSRVMPHTTYYRQTDTFVKTVFSDSGGLKT